MGRRLLVAALVFFAGTEAVAATRHVLILHSFGRDVDAHATFSSWFRTELAAASADPVEFYELSLATALLGGGQSEPTFVDYLAAFNAQNRFDLVVSLGGPAARFVQRHRRRVFATTPMLIAGTDLRHLRDTELSGLDAAVPLRIDLRGIVDDLLRVLPETREILVVLGNSPLEAYWTREFQSAVEPLGDRIRFTYANPLPLERILERAADPPEGSAIFYGTMIQDAAGVPYGAERALTAILKVARAPVFGVYDYQLGTGVVGGRLVPLQSLAKETADVARRILAEESPSRFRPAPPDPVFRYDARAISRWGIDASRLPPGSEIRFEEPSFWSLYWGRILLAVGVCAAQGLLIVWLVANRTRIRVAEAEIRDISRRLISAQEDERARLARELHDDVTQQLARLAIDAGRIGTGGAPEEDAQTIRELRTGLVRLSEHVHVVSYSLHPSILDDLGLAEAIQAECDRVADHWAVPVEIVARDVPASTPIPVSRCLYRVAQEALRNVIRHAGAREVHVRLVGERRGIRLTILDDGTGFDGSAHRTRPTLGLASMRERVRMAGGTFAVASAPGRGTTVDAWVPLEEPPA